MKRNRLNVIVLIIMGFLVIAAAVAVYYLMSSQNAIEVSKLNAEIAGVNKQADNIRASQDKNKYTPTDVVKNFLNEVKSDNTDNAKLYLTKENQNMDIKATLKLGGDLANLITGESNQDFSDTNATVQINVTVAGTETARQFSLVKEDDAWKISGIVAE